MSNGHITWNPYSGESWADMLGLVDVPLFNPAEQAMKPGNPTLLQDGLAASFAFLSSNGGRLELLDEALSWSWSSNVRHLLIIDESVQRMFLRRWDRPAESRQFRAPARGLGAEDFLSLLEQSESPRTPGVIRHVLAAFRVIRNTLSHNSAIESLKLLNGFLMAADEVSRNSGRSEAFTAAQTIGEAMGALDDADREMSGVDSLPPSVLGLRSRGLSAYFLDPEPRSGCLLISNLLFRHASSQLYQEAHLEIERDPQGYFDGFAPEDVGRGKLAKDVRYTPVNLARAMIQQAIKALGSLSDRQEPLRILDPACGSGVFLQESLRELVRIGHTGRVELHGYDISAMAEYITDFCLKHAKAEIQGSGNITTNVVRANSLEREWQQSDLVLMNPPFVPWIGLPRSQKELLRETLDEAYKGHADLAMAFLLKAVRSLKPGGVVASVLPSALLDTESGRRLRELISRQVDIITVGKFEGYSFFKTSFVEPVFIVLRRKAGVAEGEEPAPAPSAKILIAREGGEDRALRTLRISDRGELKEDKQVEIFLVPPSTFDNGAWMPERKAVYQLKERLSRLPFPKVNSLFQIHQGIRTGDNKAFLLTAEKFEDVPEEEHAYFRPVAGQGALKNGQLMPSYYVFYPYDETGRPNIRSEAELRQEVRWYYENYLAERRDILAERAKVNDWWLLTWARPWQAGNVSKWVSTYFGAAGSFAYDDEGRYVVVQGYAWLARANLVGESDPVDLQAALLNTPLPWAYLTIFNSRLFDQILSGHCPRVQGGQFNLSNRFVKEIPIPNLADPHFSATMLKKLAALGRRIHEGGFESSREEIDQAAYRAYGLREDSLTI
jgi:methylase of polypeptide subunit release factors